MHFTSCLRVFVVELELWYNEQVNFAPIIDGVLDFLYPGDCAGCSCGYDQRAILCRECDRQLENLATAASCEFCAMPLTEHGAPCPYCLGKGPPFFERVVSLGVFQEPLRSLIHRAKYSGQWPMAELLADRLMEKENTKALLAETDCLVAVPLHRLRQVGRGYNQSDVIARRIGSRFGIKVKNPAVRRVNTERQSLLHSREQRMQNVRDAFSLKWRSRIAGKRVVLVDDVMTSGATLTALARALKGAKPASLSVLVLAVADPKGRGFEVV